MPAVDIVGVVLAVAEKIASPVMRRWTHPDFEVDRVEHRGWSMVDERRRSVNVAIVVRNSGRSDAANWRAELRGVGLGLVNPRSPGDARSYKANGVDVVEWQSAEPVPMTHTRTVECKVSLSDHAKFALKVTAPYMKPLRRHVVVDWRGREPVFSVE